MKPVINFAGFIYINNMGLDQYIFVVKKDLLANPPKTIECDMFEQYLTYDEEYECYEGLDEFAYWRKWHGLNLFILKYFSNREGYSKEYIDSGCYILIDEIAIDTIIKMFNEDKLNSEHNLSQNYEYNKRILNGIKELIQEDYYIYYYASW